MCVPPKANKQIANVLNIIESFYALVTVIVVAVVALAAAIIAAAALFVLPLDTGVVLVGEVGVELGVILMVVPVFLTDE